MTSRITAFSWWFIGVLVWIAGVQLVQRDVVIDVASLAEERAHESFFYAERWNQTTPFRWSMATATVALPPRISDYFVVDIVAVGHTAPQAVTLHYDANTRLSIPFLVTNQQFRHHRLLLHMTPYWWPRWNTPTLTLTTDVMSTQGRDIGLAVHQIHTNYQARYGWVFCWELLWVAVSLWVCVCALAPRWHAWQWVIVLGVLSVFLLCEYYTIPRLVQRYVAGMVLLLCYDYRWLPASWRLRVQRVMRWGLRSIYAHPTTQHRIVHDWFVSVGWAGIAAGIVVWVRHGSSAEVWDRAIFLAVAGATLLYLGVSAWVHTSFTRDVRVRMLARMMVITSWVVLCFYGFQFEELRAGTIPRFAGFGWYCLVLVLLTSPLMRWLLDDDRPNHLRLLVLYGVASWVVYAGGFTLLTGNDYFHNLYVINETLTPVVQRFPYDDFIPQYTTMFNGMITLFTLVYQQYTPAELIDFAMLSIKATAMATSVVLVYMVYRILPKPSWAKAVILTLPVVCMASYPAWNRVIESAPAADFYSIVPVRYFSLIVVGFVGTTVLHHYGERIRPFVIVLLGMCAGLVVFNNNDFGFMAACALGITIFFYPNGMNWADKIRHIVWYVSGVVLFFPVLVALNRLLFARQFNDEYVFWFVRQFGGGFGALMIRFPGPGVLTIAVVIPLAFAALRSVLLPLRTPTVSQSPRILYAYTQLIYFAVVSCGSVLYYLNRSTANNLGITFIPLMVAVVSLWAIDGSVSRRQQSIVQYALHSAVAMPIILGLGFLNTPDMTHTMYRFSDSIVAERRYAIQQSDSQRDNLSTFPMESAQQTARVLTSAGFHPAYYGPWAQIMQVYTQIPSALIFNHPSDGLLGGSSQTVLCTHTFQRGIDVVIVPYAMIQAALTCPDFVVFADPVLPLPVALNRTDAQFASYETRMTQLIAQCATQTACIPPPAPKP